MNDLLMLGLIALGFAIAFAYAWACLGIVGRGSAG